jgi:hypothetical protein
MFRKIIHPRPGAPGLAMDPSPSDRDRDPLDRLAEEFVAQYRLGKRPAISEYIAQYPQGAEQIRDLFPALVALEQLKPDDEDQDGASAAAATAERARARPDHLGDYRIIREVGRGGMGSSTRPSRSRWAATWR